MRRWFPGTSVGAWNDWRWQLRNRIVSPARLAEMLALSPEERGALFARDPSDASGVPNATSPLPVAITPYYASLIDPDDPEDPIRRSVVPVAAERDLFPGEDPDPLAEEHDMVVPGLVHRYPDRVLFLTTYSCAVYCRYCTRSRVVGKSQPRTTASGVSPAGHGHWDAAIAYIARHTEVRDVLLSGGDPLTLSDTTLASLLERLRAIPHVEILRIGTKVPVVLPQRITPALLKTIRRFHPVWMSIHVTHPREITPEMRAATALLADAGIPMGSQTVLLRGINDNVETMTRLNQALLTCRVRPYYLYQCDPVPGSAHFRTPVSRGLVIIEGLRGHTSGYAVPHFVIDAPGGGGKIPLLPQYVRSWNDDGLVLRNYRGQTCVYPDMPERADTTDRLRRARPLR